MCYKNIEFEDSVSMLGVYPTTRSCVDYDCCMFFESFSRVNSISPEAATKRCESQIWICSWVGRTRGKLGFPALTDDT